jgi:hypothetical protein
MSVDSLFRAKNISPTIYTTSMHKNMKNEPERNFVHFEKYKLRENSCIDTRKDFIDI